MGEGGGRRKSPNLADGGGVWSECVRVRWDGECARGELPPPPLGQSPEGGAARVAERRVRTWSFGGPRRSADFVSSLRSAGRDGLRGGEGKPD